jgi:hypothetical protein
MGRRCQEEGCSKWAIGGGTPHCVAHGGGKRCQKAGCSKAARGDTRHCKAHGSGRRCQHEGCPKAAQAGGTQHCQTHGGGRRCQQEDCSKPVAKAPGSVYCRLCLHREQPDDVLESAPQQRDAAQAPQATGGLEEIVSVLERVERAGSPTGGG